MSRTSRLIDRRLAKALVLLQALMIPVSALIGWVVKRLNRSLECRFGGVRLLACELLFFMAIISSGRSPSI